MKITVFFYFAIVKERLAKYFGGSCNAKTIRKHQTIHLSAIRGHWSAVPVALLCIIMKLKQSSSPERDIFLHRTWALLFVQPERVEVLNRAYKSKLEADLGPQETS